MASVDDLEELLATRRLNGLDDNLYIDGNDTNVGSIEKKNIADKKIEDLNDFADLLRPEQRYYTNIIKKVIEDRLKDREKIKELDKKIEKEKKLTRLAQTLTDESIQESLVEFEKDYISKQTIKNKIENLKSKLKFIACSKDCNKCFDKKGNVIYRGSSFMPCFAYHQIKVLQQLLKER